MKQRISGAQRVVVLALSFAAVGPLLAPSAAVAQPRSAINQLAEKKITQLAAEPLYWRVENLPTLGEAQAAALITLGAKGGSAPGATKVAEIGPVAAINAPEYLPRNQRRGRPARGQDRRA